MSIKRAKDQQIKLLLFSSLFPHAAEPTLGIFVENRLRNLLKSGEITATVIAPVPWFPFKHAFWGAYGRAARAPRRENRDGLTIYHPRFLVIPKIGMKLTPCFLAWAAKRQLRKLMHAGNVFDIIDAHYLYPDGVAAQALSKEFRLPYVLTARGSDVTQIALMPGPQRLILNAMEKASHTITVSQSLKDKLVTLGADAGKITALRNGVSLEKFSPVNRAAQALRKDLGLEATTKIILFAGWLIKRKRVDLLIGALPFLSGVTAVLIGEGPELHSLKRQADELGVSDRVHFMGLKSPDDMPYYFSAADLLVLPSEREGWANVLLEALACGTPVVASAVDGATELVTDEIAGRLVYEFSPEAFASAIEEVLKQAPARHAVRNFAGNFSWDATTKGQIRVFQKALALPPTSDAIAPETEA